MFLQIMLCQGSNNLTYYNWFWEITFRLFQLFTAGIPGLGGPPYLVILPILPNLSAFFSKKFFSLNIGLLLVFIMSKGHILSKIQIK